MSEMRWSRDLTGPQVTGTLALKKQPWMSLWTVWLGPWK